MSLNKSVYYTAISEIIKYIHCDKELLESDMDTKVKVAKYLSEAASIALPSALAEVNAYLYNYGSGSEEDSVKEELVETTVEENTEDNGIICCECEEEITDIVKYCFICGRPMHRYCVLNKIKDKKAYCSNCIV